MTYRRADDYERATACLNEALAECRAMNDERHAADTLYHLGTVVWSDCRNREAIAFHEQAVAICERLGLTDLVAVQAYHGRGESHFNNLEPTPAIACYNRSIELARGIGDKSYESENLMMIAYAYTGYMGLADYAKAEAIFHAALDIAQRADLQWHMGPTLLGLEHVRACTGRYGEAWTGMTKTLRWLEGLRQTRYQLIAYDLMGHLLIDVGLHARAIELSQRALALARAANITFWRLRIEANLAIASIRLGRLDVGPLLESALRHARENCEGTQLVRCLEGLAELALARGDAAACQRFSDELLSLAQRGGLRELAAYARRWRGAALAASGDRATATAELKLVAAAADALGRVRLALDAARVLETLDPGGGHGARAETLAARIRDNVAGSELKACV
jgi:tetratricopeptide (TPR) repeat protein